MYIISCKNKQQEIASLFDAKDQIKDEEQKRKDVAWIEAVRSALRN